MDLFTSVVEFHLVAVYRMKCVCACKGLIGIYQFEGFVTAMFVIRLPIKDRVLRHQGSRSCYTGQKHDH